MGRKAGKSTTGWRQRYLVTVYGWIKKFDVLLVRGNMRKTPDGFVRALVSTTPHGKWEWWPVADGYGVGDHYIVGPVSAKVYANAQRPEMIGYITALRMQGYTAMDEVPSW